MKAHNLMMIWVIASLFTITLAHAGSPEQPDDKFRVDVNVDYNKPCFSSNGTYCSNNTVCNMTVTYTNNQTILVNNKVMGNRISNYNYSLISPFAIGIYKVDMVCSDGGLSGANTFYFLVNNTGSTPSITEGIIYFLSTGIVLFLFSLSLLGAVKIPWKNNRNEEGRVIGINDLKYVKIMLWFGSYIFLTVLMFLVWNITYGFLSFNTAANIFHGMFWFLMSFMFPVFGFFMVISLVNFLTDKKLKKALIRGLPAR